MNYGDRQLEVRVAVARLRPDNQFIQTNKKKPMTPTEHPDDFMRRMIDASPPVPNQNGYGSSTAYGTTAATQRTRAMRDLNVPQPLIRPPAKLTQHKEIPEPEPLYAKQNRIRRRRKRGR